MVWKAHPPALHDESIAQRQKRRGDLLDISILAVALLDLAIFARHASGDPLVLLLDAPGPGAALLVGPGHGDEILAATGAAGTVILENFDKRLQGIMLFCWSWH